MLLEIELQCPLRINLSGHNQRSEIRNTVLISMNGMGRWTLIRKKKDKIIEKRTKSKKKHCPSEKLAENLFLKIFDSNYQLHIFKLKQVPGGERIPPTGAIS